MAIVNDIYAFLNEIAPVRYQMDFDNAGFLVGDGGAAVKKALLALDVTDDVIAEAVELRAQLIVSHHPVLMMRSWRHWMRRSRAVWNRPVRQLTGARLPVDASGS